MDYKLETYRPFHRVTTLSREDLIEIYPKLEWNKAPAIVWNDDGDQVIIVGVGDKYSIISLLSDFTWYYLIGGPDGDLVEIELCGQESWVPRGAIVNRQLGLEVLLKVGTFASLLSEYTWTEQ